MFGYILRLIPFLAALGVTALDPTQCPNERVDTILHQNRMREYHLYVPPSYTGETAVPLLIGFHGFSATGVGFANKTGLRELAARENFIALFPYAEDGTWHLRGYTLGAVDDIDFTNTLIDFVSSEYSIDQNRIYATGMSQGGFVVHQLACELSDRVAAVAPIASADIPIRVAELCSAAPTAIVSFHGTSDASIPFEGRPEVVGPGGAGVPAMSAEESFEFWRETNGCGPEFDLINLPNIDPNDGTVIRAKDYINCPDGVDVTLYIVLGGGHTWPGSPIFLGNGRQSKELVASEVIWDFFEAHPRR